jgi:xylulokinase
MPLVIGIDVGDQGVRVIACDPCGNVCVHVTEPFTPVSSSPAPPSWVEQDPEMWWAAVLTCLRRLVSQLRTGPSGLEPLTALAVTSTSGTILPIDAHGRPLYPALMYNDSRAQAEEEGVQHAGSDLATVLGYRFNASFALAKIAWLRPRGLPSTRRWMN